MRKKRKKHKEKKLSISKMFETRFLYRIKPIIKKEELVVYEYISLKEYFLWLLKFILENWQILWVIVSTLLLILFWYKFIFPENKFIFVGIAYFWLIIILTFFLMLLRKAKLMFLAPIRYSYVIFLKNWVLFNKKFYSYNSKEFKKIINDISVVFDEVLLYQNKIKEKIKMIVGKGDIIILLLLFLSIINLVLFTNTVVGILIIIAITLIYVYYLIRYKNEGFIIFLTIAFLSMWQISAFIFFLLHYLFSSPYFSIFFPFLVILYIFIVAVLRESKLEAYRTIRDTLIYFILLSIIFSLIISKDFSVIKSYYIILLMVLISEDLFVIWYLRYIFSIPVVILSFLPTLFYILFVYLKQKFFPDVNEKIYYILLKFWRNVENIKTLSEQITNWLDKFINWDIFSIDKFIENKFKKVYKLIQVNQQLIDKKLIPLISSNTILKNNINVTNLWRVNRLKMKEILVKLIEMVDNYINQISIQLKEIHKIMKSDNKNKYALILKEKDLLLLNKNLINQKNTLLKLSDYFS